MQDVNRKSFSIKLAKLRYRLRGLLRGALLPPRALSYEIATPSGFTELRREPWPRLKMPKDVKRRLAPSRN